MHKQASYMSIATALTLVMAIGGGGMYVGALASDVETLEEAQKTVKEDHDRLITVENNVKHLTTGQETIKADVKLILQAVQRLETRREE